MSYTFTEVLNKYPYLGASGFDPCNGVYARNSESKKLFDMYRQMLINDESTVMAVSGVFSRLPRTRRLNYDRTSYSFKHLFEEMLGIYVSQGTCIAAAYISGIPLKRCDKDHAGAYLGIQERVVEQLDEHLLIHEGRGADFFTDAIMTRLHTPQTDMRPKGPIGLKLRFQILRRDHYRCRLCGVSARDGQHIRLEVDHITARSRGGTNDPMNLMTLCHDCNLGKGAQDL